MICVVNELEGSIIPVNAYLVVAILVGTWTCRNSVILFEGKKG
jgi:hypothetical protein